MYVHILNIYRFIYMCMCTCLINPSLLQCVAVWCSVLQCGTVCCSVLHIQIYVYVYVYLSYKHARSQQDQPSEFSTYESRQTRLSQPLKKLKKTVEKK